MNWFSTARNGSYVAAGLCADALDSMNRNPVVYDAVGGKIFTVGGSPSYQDSNATNLAYHITVAHPISPQCHNPHTDALQACIRQLGDHA
jgi:galactose oxidase